MPKMPDAPIVDCLVDCPECGETMTRVERPPFIVAWRWFNYGYRPWRQADMECSACGAGVATMSLYSSGRSIRGRISHLRSHCTLEPVPRFYATVAVAGIGLGWLAGRVLERPRVWWKLPLAAVAAAWLVMESSAPWDHGPDDEDHEK